MGKLTWQYIRKVQRKHLFRGKLQLDPKYIIGRLQIYYEGQPIGFAQRGHALIYPNSKRRKKGIYSEALKKIEQIEIELARRDPSKYGKYVEKIISHELELYAPFEVGYIRKITQPTKRHFFDYTPYFDTAGALVKNGYMPTPHTLEILERQGLIRGATPEQMATWLFDYEKKYGIAGVVQLEEHWLVFTKPM